MQFGRLLRDQQHEQEIDRTAVRRIESDRVFQSHEAADGFLAKFSAMLDAKFGKTEPVNPPEPKKEDESGATDFAQLQPLFADLGKTFGDEMAAFRKEAADREDAVDLRFKALEDKLQATPAKGYSQRPVAAGANGDQEMTDC